MIQKYCTRTTQTKKNNIVASSVISCVLQQNEKRYMLLKQHAKLKLITNQKKKSHLKNQI